MGDLMSGEGKETLDKMLGVIETVFTIVLCLFLAFTVLGQILLSTPEGRSNFSRVERLEGIRLNVDIHSRNNSG